MLLQTCLDVKDVRLVVVGAHICTAVGGGW